MLTYLEEDAALICRCLPKNIARPDDEEFPLFLIYAVLMRAKGTAATLSDVHDAWAAWRVDSAPLHKSLVPFDELDAATQALDQPYLDAIHAADGGPARDADGFEYVATLPVAPRQITARPNLSGGAV